MSKSIENEGTMSISESAVKETSVVDEDISEASNSGKISFSNFLGREIAVYLSQIYLFFWVAFLFSASLTNEDKMSEYLNGVISGNQPLSMFYIFVASVITIGTIEFIAKGMNKTSIIKLVSDDVALSVGRAMYTIGSSGSGACLAVAIFLLVNRESDTELAITYSWLSLGLGVVLFLYGFLITWWCRKESILKDSNEPLS